MNKRDSTVAVIVEDDGIIALALKDILTEHGFEEVQICSSASCAVEILAEKQPQLILLDTGLADRSDGWSIAELAREIISPIPQILFVTGDPASVPPNVAKLGTILPKPVSAEELINALN